MTREKERRVSRPARLVALAAAVAGWLGPALLLVEPARGAPSFSAVSARRSWADPTRLTVTFSEAVEPESATATSRYTLEGGTVIGARPGARAAEVVLTTTPIDRGPAPRLRVDGVRNAGRTGVVVGAGLAVDLAPVLPAEMGGMVHGFEDDFDGPARHPAWRAIGPDVYWQAGGRLSLGVAAGDPNHLVHVDPAAEGVAQEILVRLRLTQASPLDLAFAGVAVGVPTNSWSLPVRGGLNLNLYPPGAFGGPARPHPRMLSDGRAFGPALEVPWTTQAWYWVRLRQRPDPEGPDAFAKVWLADGDTPEPADWQAAWELPVPRAGHAGLRAGTEGPGSLADAEVDYVLIQAPGLPAITPRPAAFQAEPGAATLTITRDGDAAVVAWPAEAGPAQLQQSGDLARWSAAPHPVAAGAGRFAARVPLAGEAAQFRAAPRPADPAPEPGFSFDLGGIPWRSAAGGWAVAESVTVLDPGRTRRVRSHTRRGDGFRFEVESVDLAGYAAREWKLWFEQPAGSGEFFRNATGLSNPPVTVTFTEHPQVVPGPGVPARAITVEYADRGLFFDAATPVYWDPGGVGAEGGGQVLNYQPHGGGFTGPTLPVYFTRPQRSAAFALAVEGGATSARFEALRNGVPVRAATAPVGGAEGTRFYGFRDVSGGFDCLRITPDRPPAYLRIDQVQLEVVPNGWVAVDFNGRGPADPPPATYAGGGPGGGGIWNGPTLLQASPNTPMPAGGWVAGGGLASPVQSLLAGFTGAGRTPVAGQAGQALFEDQVSLAGGPATLRLRGLSPGGTYELFLFAAAGGVFSVPDGMIRTASGGVGAPFSEGRDFVHLTAPASALGQLAVTVQAGPAGVAGLNGFQVVGPTVPFPASEVLSEVWAGEFTLGRGGDGEFVLHHADGSSAVISDFQPRTTVLRPGTETRFAPVGGRSSDGVLPYFNVARPGGGGLIVAVGWTGQWKVSFARDPGTNLTVRVGMEDFRLRLHPGERFRTPGVLTLSYAGDWMDGQRQFRRLLLDHFTPRPGGRPVVPPVAASGATLGFNNVTAANQVRAITNLVRQRLPVDTYWVDAGWEAGGFPLGQGNHRPDPARFPDGLGPVGRCARTNGLRFLLWFEPERVMPNTWLRTNQADWLLAPSGMPPEYAYQQRDGWRLLNLGHPDALAWAKAHFSRLVAEWAVDIYRHDFNLHPLWYWRTGEAGDRRGVNEIRHVMGLYDYFDTLQRDHPGLLLDNSASGGRRLDYEMYRRLVPLLRTDYLWEPVGAQAMTHGLSHWLPRSGQGGVSTANHDFRSGLGSWGSYAFDYYRLEAPFWEPLRAQLAGLAPLQRLFSGDFYPLTPYSTNRADWIAWQFHRADLGEGIVQAFRRDRNPTPAIGLRLAGLEPGATYQVIDLERGITRIARGRELMDDGVGVRVENAPEAATLHYRRNAE